MHRALEPSLLDGLDNLKVQTKLLVHRPEEIFLFLQGYLERFEVIEVLVPVVHIDSGLSSRFLF